MLPSESFFISDTSLGSNHFFNLLESSDSLTINCRKAKTLSLTRNTNGPVQVGGEQIEAVDKFTYLGREIDASGGTDLNNANLRSP